MLSDNITDENNILNSSLLLKEKLYKSGEATMYRFMKNYSHILGTFNITADDLDYMNNYSAINVNNDPAVCYCGGYIRELALAYRIYHGYVALMVCIFGTVANILNIMVLTRKDMVIAPINRILSCLALADVLVMIEYIPFAIYEYFVLPKKQRFPYGWAVFVLFHMHFAQLLHTISIALTLTLAIWRYIAIR